MSIEWFAKILVGIIAFAVISFLVGEIFSAMADHPFDPDED